MRLTYGGLKPSAGATMSEQRLAAEVKFNLSKENIFVSVCLIYTLRLAVWALKSFQFESAELDEESFFNQQLGQRENELTQQHFGCFIDNLFKLCIWGFSLRMCTHALTVTVKTKMSWFLIFHINWRIVLSFMDWEILLFFNPEKSLKAYWITWNILSHNITKHVCFFHGTATKSQHRFLFLRKKDWRSSRLKQNLKSRVFGVFDSVTCCCDNKRAELNRSSLAHRIYWKM